MATESNKPHAFNPPDIPPPPPSYKHVAITPLFPTSKLITLAGMTGSNPAGMPKTVSEQATIAYDKIKKGLAAAGATPRDIVQVKHYIVKETGDVEIDKIEVVERGWAAVWIDFMDHEADGHKPPDTVIGVASLAKHDILYECEVWAIIHT
jgi:enamine deaminase RidA (YjgF/YER057c/UK114 family)